MKVDYLDLDVVTNTGMFCEGGLSVTEEHLVTFHKRRKISFTVNMLCLSMGLGGAERIVADLFWSFRTLRAKGWPVRANLFILSQSRKQYGIVTDSSYRSGGKNDGVTVWPTYEVAHEQRLAAVATGVLNSGSDVLYTHMVPQEALEELWERGVRTIPVIHNMRARWNCDPATFAQPRVPAVVAVSEAVRRDVLEWGCAVAVHTIVHELPRLRGPVLNAEERRRLREKYGVSEGTALIGMVGKIKSQKRYDVAIRALRRLIEDTDAHLMIVGPWKGSDSPSRSEYERLARLVQRFGVAGRVHFVRGSRGIGKFLSIFDVFLNTSAFEGLSIATLEARAHGLPLVLSEAGGQRERCGKGDVLVPPSSRPDVYAAAIKGALLQGRRQGQTETRIGLVPRLWAWIANFAVEPVSAATHPSVLFITNNLAQGGAQRSLTNLLAEIAAPHPISLCALSEPFVPTYMAGLERKNVQTFSFPTNTTLWERVEGLLTHIRAAKTGTLCFWNADFKIKALLTKVLGGTGMRFIDVSPGPQMFRGVQRSEGFLTRMAYSGEEYFERIDRYVSKYSNPEISSIANAALQKLEVIPNGVPLSSVKPSMHMIRPRGVQASHAVVSVGRIVPAKMVDRILRVAARLRELDDRITVSLIGRTAAPEAPAYFPMLQKLYEELQLEGTVFFLGEADDALSFLPQFRAFLMLSKMQGCPNASLEAMAAALPVVANPDGGTAEQVEDGVTGFLVSDDDLEQVAQRVKWLLDHPEDARRMGERGRQKVAAEFSMEAMGRRYRELLWPCEVAQ